MIVEIFDFLQRYMGLLGLIGLVASAAWFLPLVLMLAKPTESHAVHPSCRDQIAFARNLAVETRPFPDDCPAADLLENRAQVERDMSRFLYLRLKKRRIAAGMDG